MGGRGAGAYLSLLSSAGITRHLGTEVGILPCAKGLDRRAVLAEASRQAWSRSKTGATDVLESIIRESIASSRVRRFHGRATSMGEQLDYREAIVSEGRVQIPAAEPDWQLLQDKLNALGFSLEPFSITDVVDERLLNPNLPFSLWEILDTQTGEVFAGGKGLDRGSALKSALGEFAERYVASHPRLVFAASEGELTASGVTIPDLSPGERDSYSPELIHDWIMGSTPQGLPAALPAERTFYDYIPQSGVRAFAWQHTAGLASGASIEEAAWAGFSECLERDAYWITVRCKLALPVLPQHQLLGGSPRIEVQLEKAGLEVVLKDMSLDWPLPIVHAVIIDKSGRLPAFSHGVGSGLSFQDASKKAVLEALQIRAGLLRISVADLGKSAFPSRVREAARIWCDPASRRALSHLIDGAVVKRDVEAAASLTPEKVLEAADRSAGPIIVVPLGSVCGLEVVRAFVAGALLPDPLQEDVPPRLLSWLKRSSLSDPYREPVLT